MVSCCGKAVTATDALAGEAGLGLADCEAWLQMLWVCLCAGQPPRCSWLVDLTATAAGVLGAIQDRHLVWLAVRPSLKCCGHTAVRWC